MSAHSMAVTHDGITSRERISTVPAPAPVSAAVLIELAKDLRDLNLHTAARLVIEGRREYADTIVEDIGGDRAGAAGSLAVRSNGPRGLIAAQVRVWGAGNDAAVIASNIAWTGTSRSNGCVECGHAALKSGNSNDRCDDCKAEVSEPVALSAELQAAARDAVSINAEGWCEGFPGERFTDGDGACNDSIHVDTLNDALGREMTEAEHAAVWPVYRDMLVAEVDRLLALPKGDV